MPVSRRLPVEPPVTLPVADLSVESISRPASQATSDLPVIDRLKARVLRSLLPVYPEDPTSEWPLLNRQQLNLRSGFTSISGSCTRALNGVKAGSSSKYEQVGLVRLGMVTVVVVVVEGIREDNYCITHIGIEALRRYLLGGGCLPPMKDPSVCTNRRYEKSTIQLTSGE